LAGFGLSAGTGPSCTGHVEPDNYHPLLGPIAATSLPEPTQTGQSGAFNEGPPLSQSLATPLQRGALLLLRDLKGRADVLVKEAFS